MRKLLKNSFFPLFVLLFAGLFVFFPVHQVLAEEDTPGTVPTVGDLGYCAVKNMVTPEGCGRTQRQYCVGSSFYPLSAAGAQESCQRCVTGIGTCEPVQGSLPPSGTPPAGGNTAANQFVPLTNLPGLTNAPQDRTLADYINVLYRISIGIGALIAVIKITLAGIKYMGQDAGFSSKEEAKKDITNSLLGLLIMLSTVVILQLIYPNILNINVLQGLEAVKVQPQTTTTGPVTTGPTGTIGRPNGETCAVNANCMSANCNIPAGQTVGTCQPVPAQSGLSQGTECNAGQQPNPCATPLKCTAALTPCTTNVTGFCGRSTCQP